MFVVRSSRLDVLIVTPGGKVVMVEVTFGSYRVNKQSGNGKPGLSNESA